MSLRRRASGGQIPLPLRQVVRWIDDARFYENGAVDFIGLARAALRSALMGEHA